MCGSGKFFVRVGKGWGVTPSAEEFQERLDRINSIFTAILDRAEESSITRCPYRDSQDLCTALFSCRNQLPIASKAGSFSCSHDGSFDYRPAWESNPKGWKRMQEKTASIREEALKNRRSSN